LTGGAASEQSPQQTPSPSHAVCERNRPTPKTSRHDCATPSRRRRRAFHPPRLAGEAGTSRGRTKTYEKPAIASVYVNGARVEHEERVSAVTEAGGTKERKYGRVEGEGRDRREEITEDMEKKMGERERETYNG